MLNNDGVVSKKKLVETAKPVAFKSIQPIRINEVEAAVVQKPVATPNTGAKLTIEEPAQRIETKVLPNIPVSTEPKKSLGSLAAIRNKVSAQNKNGKEVKELTEQDLRICWEKFIEKLVAKKNHSAVTNFKMAELKIIDNNSIEIITENNIQQKFIEQERAGLIEDFQEYFCNRQLTYNVIIVESAESDGPKEKQLSRKEQYAIIANEYPLVDELRKRLRLELD